MIHCRRVVRRAQDLLTSNTVPPGSDVHDESLGGRRFADVETTGRRVTMMIPVGQLRNDKPFEIVDERSESPELKVLIAGRVSDSRMGEVAYQLTNIRRGEPPADLFVVPPDYTVDTTPTPNEGTWIALTDADRYPAVGVALGNTLGPR